MTKFKLLNLLPVFMIGFVPILGTAQESPAYQVKRINKHICIDGRLDETEWSTADSINFRHHYFVVNPGDRQKTQFKMLWDEANLYLAYKCSDQYLTAKEKNRDGATFLDDCAEIFLVPIKGNQDIHFCFEINLYKTINDIVYLNKFVDGNDIVIKGFNCDYQAAVSYIGTLNDNSDRDMGWAMEVAIPFKNFNRLLEQYAIANGTQWSFMALRQNRDELNSERRSISSSFPIYEIEKDVHQPQYFGIMEFVE